ncbi:MAG: GntR family transcriptional regulator [Lachnospiraceae bacterium]|nr:GntR family transcriptional regulator [Lachnospiraceae bacterium]
MAKSNKMLSQTAYQYILDLIMTKQLLPKDKVAESSVAKQFQISRTPVRDAMQQLANEGLLEIFPNRYVQVKEYSMDDIIEIGVLRLALDTLSVKLASLFGSRVDFMKLDDIATQCEKASLEGDDQQKRELDCKFHMTLAEITGNELLIKFQKELYLRIQYIMLCYPNTIERETEHLRQHHKIAQALINNNLDLALELIVDHLSSFYNLSSKYPEDFFRSTSRE